MENKGKIILFLIACILLTGCGKEAETEGQQPEVNADSLAGDRADNYSSMDGIADIDGNVSSPEQSIQCEIMSGNFSRLDASAEFREHIKNTFERWAGGETCEIEWQIIDLNGDGIDDLIVQDRDTVGESEVKQILGIFACDENSARCVEWDLNDMTEYSFCGPTGELMYTAYNYGHIPDEEPYWHYHYDRDWNKIGDYLLVIYWIDSTVDPDYAKIWREEHPDLAEDGIYYRKYTEDAMEELTRGEWEEMYEAATGYKVDSELIRREEWRQEKQKK